MQPNFLLTEWAEKGTRHHRQNGEHTVWEEKDIYKIDQCGLRLQEVALWKDLSSCQQNFQRLPHSRQNTNVVMGSSEDLVWSCVYVQFFFPHFPHLNMSEGVPEMRSITKTPRRQ